MLHSYFGVFLIVKPIWKSHFHFLDNFFVMNTWLIMTPISMSSVRCLWSRQIGWISSKPSMMDTMLSMSYNLQLYTSSPDPRTLAKTTNTEYTTYNCWNILLGHKIVWIFRNFSGAFDIFMKVTYCTMKVLKANRNVRVSDSRVYARTNLFKGRSNLLLFRV